MPSSSCTATVCAGPAVAAALASLTAAPSSPLSSSSSSAAAAAARYGLTLGPRCGSASCTPLVPERLGLDAAAVRGCCRPRPRPPRVLPRPTACCSSLSLRYRASSEDEEGEDSSSATTSSLELEDWGGEISSVDGESSALRLPTPPRPRPRAVEDRLPPRAAGRRRWGTASESELDSELSELDISLRAAYPPITAQSLL